MDQFIFLNVIMEVTGTLNDQSCKLMLKAKKLMFSVLAFPLLFNCLSYLIFESKFFLPLTDPSTPEDATHLIRYLIYLPRFFSSLYIFIAVSAIFNLLSVLVMVHASALIHKDDSFKIKDFPILTLKYWKGPLETNFYISLLSLGYWFLFFIILFPLVIFSTKLDAVAAKYPTLGILFAVLKSYSNFIWYFSMGIWLHAFGKAAENVKGMNPKLFLLNLFTGLVSYGLVNILRLIEWSSSFPVTLTYCLVLVSSVFLVRMFQLMTYTVTYFQCKSLQGKDADESLNISLLS
ncbi:hypothetical protein CARUB_v10014302mg [Capsella rubella]|uniref:Uncharacterized protein n=1 Tax=Capsella rubella TaxID=81985 RepID=R0HZW0_9BRAS|nr:uncharacterized protein LOC17893789 [Capsella rubella]EOA31140.1 hypothetical protein CARUB_v10014302mg [Capsella rubella]